MRARIFVAFLCGSPKMKVRRLSTTPSSRLSEPASSDVRFKGKSVSALV